MAKSLRSKRKKRIRTIRRDMVEPYYEKKDEAKLKAQEAALNAPKLPVYVPKSRNPESMDLIEAPEAPSSSNLMDVEMAEGGNELSRSLLKPVGVIGKKKLQKKMQLKKHKRRNKGKGKIRRKKI